MKHTANKKQALPLQLNLSSLVKFSCAIFVVIVIIQCSPISPSTPTQTSQLDAPNNDLEHVPQRLQSTKRNHLIDHLSPIFHKEILLHESNNFNPSSQPKLQFEMPADQFEELKKNPYKKQQWQLADPTKMSEALKKQFQALHQLNNDDISIFIHLIGELTPQSQSLPLSGVSIRLAKEANNALVELDFNGVDLKNVQAVHLEIELP